ncbi:T9SS type A sorting domain-containing protein [Fluviicola sp.]|jgi:hypothetical protein|uniref:T9SS type A sorting domain-containing protein n=1 Tax=Fluviicola sp. TaxID=1917219 RepID=UPI002826575F|nr:T9SS type A sorting domain-containing protein [Fluviicola sp.]MDR0802091.1 T9SS type A sorting domain-containing protein [Fluviicola sp.]
MKKIYAILALALATTASFGQRHFDIALNLSTPADGSTVPQSASQPITFSLTHSGDALAAGDTLALYYYNVTQNEIYSLDESAGYYTIFVLTSQMATLINGGSAVPSMVFNSGSQMTLNTLASGFNTGDTILVVAEIWAGINDEDTDLTNNFGSFILSAPLPASVTNLNTIALSAYPNPALSELNVTADEQIVSLTIIDMEGKVVATAADSRVDVSTLTSGVYMYEATTVSGLKAINKFIKQ